MKIKANTSGIIIFGYLEEYVIVYFEIDII
jgi:hypothetical protein